MKTKKILFFLFVLLFSIGSITAQGFNPFSNPPGGGDSSPTAPGEGVNDVPGPIDGQIWLGLLGGLAIGGYFFIKKRAVKID
jgi:hypothetical protein